jgi:hypothetical protein
MFGDIFICQFPFTSGAASKIRPALVLFDLEQDAIICRVTGVLRAPPWMSRSKAGKRPVY